MNHLICGDRQLDLTQAIIMGVLNVTPDSFSDGGRWQGHEQALAHAEQMLEDGAAIIDIGGESTRPGAATVSETAELERVIPVIEALHKTHPKTILSIDTSKPAVMQAALNAGAHLINDVHALQAEGALAVAAASNCGLCLMHRQGTPQTMQQRPDYVNVIAEVNEFLGERLNACVSAGIDRNRIALDPGFGFGKTLQHNLSLLGNLEQLTKLGQPLLAGLSRKAMLGQITGADTDDRVVASVTAAVLAAQNGATILRVHDVAATRQGLQVWQAMRDTVAQ